MRKIKVLISTVVTVSLVVGLSFSCYAACIGGGVFNADGSFTSYTQSEIDLINAAAPIYTPEMEAMLAAGRSAEEILALCPNRDANQVVDTYLYQLHGGAVDSQGCLVPSQSVVVRNQVDISQPDLLVYLQAQGYTLDAAGRVVPITK